MSHKPENILIDFNSPIKCELDMQCPLVPAPGRKMSGTFLNLNAHDASDNPFDLVIQQLHINNKDDDPFELVFEKACRSDQNSEIPTSDTRKAEPDNSHAVSQSELLLETRKSDEVVDRKLTTYQEKFEAYKAIMHSNSNICKLKCTTLAPPSTVDCVSRKDVIDVNHSRLVMQDDCIKENGTPVAFRTSGNKSERFIDDESSSCIFENMSDSIIVDSLVMGEVDSVVTGKLVSPVHCKSSSEQKRVGELVELELNRTIELMSQLSTSASMENGLSGHCENEIMSNVTMAGFIEGVGKSKQNGCHIQNGSLNMRAVPCKSINRSYEIENKSELANTESDIKAIVADRVQKCIQKALNDSKTIPKSSHGSSENDYQDSSAINLLQGGLATNKRNHQRSFSSSVLDKGSLSTSKLQDTTLPITDPLFSGLNLEGLTSSYYKRRLESITQNFGTGDDDFLNKRFRFNVDDASCNTRKSSLSSIWGDLKKHSVSNMPTDLSNNIGFMKHSMSLTNTSSSDYLNGISRQHNRYSLDNMSRKVLNEKSLAMVEADDSVLMEARSISCVFQHKADTYNYPSGSESSDEGDYITNSKKPWERSDVSLPNLDSDDSLDGSIMDAVGHPTRQIPGRKSFDGSLSNKTESKTLRRSSSMGSAVALSSLPALSQDNIRGLGLQSRRKNSSPVLVPPPPVPLVDKRDSRLKPIKRQIGSQPGKKGPMKAMMPLGSMMRNPSAKVTPVESSGIASNELALPKLATKMRPIAQSTPSRDKNSSLALQDSKMFSPILQGQGVTNQKTPVLRGSSSTSGIPSLTSPPLSLRTSPKELFTGHERSKSVDHLQTVKASSPPNSSAAVSATKIQHHMKPTNSAQNYKKSILKVSAVQEPKKKVSVLTPLKALPKNSPIVSRRGKLSMVKPLNQLFKRGSAVAAEKENVIPQ